MRMRLTLALLVGTLALGCDGDGGTDADAGSTPDASTRDAGGMIEDAGSDTDAGPEDAGADDAGADDGGPSDAGAIDAGEPDAGTLDAGADDAGAGDAGSTDAGLSDAGPSDAGPADAGRADGGIRPFDAGCIPPVCAAPPFGCRYVGGSLCSCGTLFCASSCGLETCAFNQWCNYEEDLSCSGSGRCETRPDFCPEIYEPVCGCDGVTHSNACFARFAGVDVASRGECGGISPGL